MDSSLNSMISVSWVSRFSIKYRISGETGEPAPVLAPWISEDVSVSTNSGGSRCSGSEFRLPREGRLDFRNSGRLHLLGIPSPLGSSSNWSFILSAIWGLKPLGVLLCPGGDWMGPTGSSCCLVLLG